MRAAGCGGTGVPSPAAPTGSAFRSHGHEAFAGAGVDTSSLLLLPPRSSVQGVAELGLFPCNGADGTRCLQVAEVWGGRGRWRRALEQALRGHAVLAQPPGAEKLHHRRHGAAGRLCHQHGRDCRWALRPCGNGRARLAAVPFTPESNPVPDARPFPEVPLCFEVVRWFWVSTGRAAVAPAFSSNMGWFWKPFVGLEKRLENILQPDGAWKWHYSEWEMILLAQWWRSSRMVGFSKQPLLLSLQRLNCSEMPC